ncbi:TPA: CppA N-terminal domain-containing protein [Streptococcus pneumoniae]
MNVNQIVRIIPTLKANNRKLNETFYIETLGMKALLEESAFLSLGDQTGLEKLVLEEAPSMRTRKVEGRKKLARLIVKVENPLEIEGILSKTDSIHRLYKGQNSYAFEIFSPSLSKFEISMELHLPTDIESFLESSEIGASLDFIPAQGQDLTVDNTVTWDLSMLKFLVNELDIASLRQKFESTEYFIPKSEKFFLGKDRNNVELWFEEV